MRCPCLDAALLIACVGTRAAGEPAGHKLLGATSRTGDTEIFAPWASRVERP